MASEGRGRDGRNKEGTERSKIDKSQSGQFMLRAETASECDELAAELAVAELARRCKPERDFLQTAESVSMFCAMGR